MNTSETSNILIAVPAFGGQIHYKCENAVAEAAKILRGMKWARVAEFEMLVDGKRVAE